MTTEPVWWPYATFDDEGFVNGIRQDAPDYAKQAYEAEQAEIQRYIDAGEPMPK